MLYGYLPFENELKNGMRLESKGAPVPFTWSPRNVYQLYEYIMRNRLQFPKTPTISEDAKHLLTALLDIDPVTRINMDQVKNHPWLLEANQIIKHLI